ncbi:FKBP-type peptidyl-prolyl cis-trans isomerase [Lysobacter sp. CFH 32150]|uniref:FKBP-type peptidyl-prolyl cis-trans isomerase n=1 Tax=Lysobacter sp. CFH 32150 TaxID=2927128 RepID=UPI001FA73392|nr:FKBP-type peptidyl-prolyl cis-trans isomerase [Lysobacter sp. CFH 32150]MCI4569502.1 FKBP-type peptidyl-prolyl cis-trans isomerase [Lysobacter sp. CFH 32150]
MRRSQLIAALLTLLVALAFGCASSPKPINTSSGLVYTVVKKGSGPTARAGQYVTIHETTMFSDGRVHFSTRTNGQPLRFLLGGKQVIDGVDEAVTGMRVGEHRKLIVPPSLSKRTTYSDGLSPEDTLYYDVELIAIEAP